MFSLSFVFLFCFSPLLLSFPHPSMSVTKRRKAHLKRLDRRWTLGGIVNRQQSRGEHIHTHAWKHGISTCRWARACVQTLAVWVHVLASWCTQDYGHTVSNPPEEFTEIQCGSAFFCLLKGIVNEVIINKLLNTALAVTSVEFNLSLGSIFNKKEPCPTSHSGKLFCTIITGNRKHY